MSERMADRLRHLCWLQSQLPAPTVGGRWGFPQRRPTGWQLRSGLLLIGLGGDRNDVWPWAGSHRCGALLLNYHDKLQRSWAFPSFICSGCLKIWQITAEPPVWYIGKGSESGSGAPPDLAGLLESACAEEERPWEIIPTTWLHLCVPLGRCDVRQASWQLVEVVPQQWHHQWAFLIRIFVSDEVIFALPPPSLLDHYHNCLGPGWDAQGTRKCPLVKVRVSLVGTWSPSRFFNHDSAGHLWCINNTPCLSEWDVSVVLRGGLALNQTK